MTRQQSAQVHSRYAEYFGGEIIFVSVQRYSGGNLLAGPVGDGCRGRSLNSFVNSGVSGVVSATPLPN